MPTTRLLLVASLAVVLFARRTVAYPYYVGSNLCGDSAHPTGPDGDHGYVGETPDVSFAIYWSARNGSSAPQAWEYGENATSRLMPDAWLTSPRGDEYPPGARLTVVVDASALTVDGNDDGLVGMVLVTADGGRFEDVDMHEEHVENGATRSALRCGGARVNPSLRTNKHKLIWYSPEGTDDVKLRVTTASAGSHPFYQASVTLRANARLTPPSERANATSADNATAVPTHDHSTVVGDNSVRKPIVSEMTAFAAHGVMMFIGIWMFMPGAVGWSLFGRPGPLDKPSATWLKWHTWLMVSASVTVVIAALVAYGEIRDIGATHYGCPHGKIGVVVVVLAACQPVGGFLRPPNPPEGEPKSTRRRFWERAHRVIGYTIFFLGFIAVLTGIDELGERDESVPARFQTVVFALYVAVGVFAFIFLHHKLSRNAASSGRFQRVEFVELPEYTDRDARALAP